MQSIHRMSWCTDIKQKSVNMRRDWEKEAAEAENGFELRSRAIVLRWASVVRPRFWKERGSD